MSGEGVIAWLGVEQASLVGEVAALAGCRIIAAGSPDKGQAGAAAAALGVEPIDDLRETFAGAECALVLLASPGAFGTEPGGADDAAALLAARARGVKIATLEPIPATALDLTAGGWTTGRNGIKPIDAIRFVPMARLSPAFREADEVLESFGHVRMVSIEAWNAPTQGSLGATLFNAADLVMALLGEPETIDAAYVSPGQGRGLHMLPEPSLRDLHGEAAATLRFADGRSASLVVGDQGGRWNRTATLVGPSGRLRVFDDGFEWIDPDGKKVDEARVRRRGETASHAAEAIADGIARLLDPHTPAPGPADHTTILSIAQAALLSTRTGQPESPATIRHMTGG
jgi:predicted dehydrogenase